MKHSGFRIVAVVLIFILLVAAVAGALIWLKIAHLKTQLAEDLGKALGAKVEVTSLELDVRKGELHAAGIKLTNERPSAPWNQGQISQATVHFKWSDLLAPTLPVQVEVAAWQVMLHPAEPQEPANAGENEPGEGAPAKGRKGGIEVTHLAAQQGEVEIDLANGRKVQVHGVSFDASNDGGPVWTTQVQATSISDGSLQMGNSSAEIRSDPDKLTFPSFRLQCAQGMITGSGEMGLNGAHATQMNLKAFNVPMAMLVQVKWQMKLSGLVSGTLTYQGDDQAAQAQGQLSVSLGKFNVLPFLSQLTMLVGLPDVTGMEVDQATSDFLWKDHVLHLTHIDIRKNDALRVAGQMDIDGSSELNGELKLGLPETVLTKWPQLQSAVFSSSTDGFGWTDVHVTGTPDHVQEDLSSRLLAVGVQQGAGILNQGSQKALDLLKSFMGP